MFAQLTVSIIPATVSAQPQAHSFDNNCVSPLSSPHITNFEKNERAPLHEAAALGYVEVCSILLAANADLNTQDTVSFLCVLMKRSNQMKRK
jgi:ankyrin repeat protein